MSDVAFLLTILLLAFLVWLGWYWFIRRRRVRPLAVAQRALLAEKVDFYRRLPEADKKRFEESIALFLSEVAITGVETEVTEADRLLVAASAVIPLFGFPGWRYRNLNEVLLYPDTFDEDYQVQAAQRNIIGMVGSGAMNRMMILSQPALRASFAHPERRHNVGIHEFIHLLDKADGSTDGIPEVLIPQEYVVPWLRMMHHEIQEIKAYDSDINPYGATNEAEFLSVAAEYFFSQPEQFERKHPKLYTLLSRIFRQEP
ncbi:MAG: zinc-dependent peptidase [Phaeodactylibacter sp.]|nr:zinc-dependent peptidase [Phaeodactylibacter sp.]MCB9048968.1 zinc-dependent peptidase [Lewinellaceae bacterium]